MAISEFVNITKNCKDLTFRQIWDIYDKQFEILREAIIELGDKIVVETFTGTNPEKELSTEYLPNHIMVYLNNAIQWKDIDYVEESSTKVRMLAELEEGDVVKVLVLKSSTVLDYTRVLTYDEETKTLKLELN